MPTRATPSLRQRWKKGDVIAPKSHGGGPAPALDDSALWDLRQIVKIRPDATLAELCAALKDTGRAAVSPATVCRALGRLAPPLKKSLHADERDSARVRALRGWWRHRAEQTDPQSFVFVDESGANTAMTRLCGRTPPGQRVAGAVPGHWGTLTVLGALRLSGLVAGGTVAGPTDTALFGAFIRNSLLPALHPGDVVAWDNLPAHDAANLELERQAVEAELRLLPPYSPDLSPIEPMWSNVKQYLRTAAARTPTALGQAAADAFDSVTDTDAHGWFRNCGYCVN